MSTRRAWFRPTARRMPPECVFMLVVMGMALGLYLAVAPPRPAVTASVAPACADSTPPCRRAQ